MPMPRTKSLYGDDTLLSEEEAQTYRSQVGSLNYFSMATRFDIALATSRLSQLAHKPTRSAQQAMQRVLQYLAQSVTRRLESRRRQGEDEID